MPQIRQFENPIDGLTPSDRGVQSAILKARHIEAEYSGIGQELGHGIAAAGDAYTTIKTQQDVSVGLAQKAQLWDNLTTAQDVHMKNADPNDHAAAERFQEEQVKPILDAWTTGFSTEQSRAWANEQAGQLQQHFTERGHAIQGEQAGAAAVQNVHDTTTGLSNTAMQDPASLNTLLGAADQGIDALVAGDPNLSAQQVIQIKGELRDHMRQEIAKSAFIGTARANPEQAMQDIVDGKYKHLLDGTTTNSMFGFAESLQREKRADARAEYSMQKEAQKDDFNTKAAALQVSVFQPDGSIKVPPGFHQQLALLALHPGAEPGRIEALGNAMKTATEASINGTFTQTKNSTWQGLAGRIGTVGNGALTHTMVDQAYAAGDLSNHDYEFLHRAVETAKTDPATNKAETRLNQSLERLKPLVDHSNIYKLDQSGAELYDDLHYDTFARYQQLVGSGKSASEAVDILTDPRNPQGIQANLTPYQTNNKAGLAALRARVAPTGGPTNVRAPALTNPRKPGESAQDYLKRTGG